MDWSDVMFSLLCLLQAACFLNAESLEEEGTEARSTLFDLGGPVYTHQWAVEIDGDIKTAESLANKHGFTCMGEILPKHYMFQHNHVAKRSIEHSHHMHGSLSEEPQVKWLEQQIAKKRIKRDTKQFTDPKWPRMWYLRRGPNLDMNVMDAWEKGFTGDGVVVSILDDGIEKDHPDLKKNYDAEASYDVNGMDPDPQPRYDYSNENRHGTRCAGEVAAEANNDICSVGVAYGARIGGVRMLDGDVTDAVEAGSLGRNPQHIDIYSASWGPDDDGKTVDGPAPLARKAFADGISQGRQGKGSIFVWASGNGGRSGDSCSCDGYTNSIYTLSISSATEHGNIPWYSEACASTLATTYSSGSGNERQIVTTDLRKSCTEYHTGTSASAPLAAGIIALALQANSHLTWRDMQHIVVMTARPTNLHATDWITNGMGRRVSHHFGFGLMDASAMVNMALNWTTVPEQHVCKLYSLPASRGIVINGKVEVYLESDGCWSDYKNSVMYLEHVEAIVSLDASRRGEIEMFLTSPHGTRSTLLAKRSRDVSREGFKNWAFMTTHNWGELSTGTWKLEIHNGLASYHPAKLHSWRLVLHGTAAHPYHPTSRSTDQFTKPRTSPSPYFIDSVGILRNRNVTPRPRSPPQRINKIPRIEGCAPPTTTPPPTVQPEAELKTWSLVLYGTATHPQESQQYNPDQDVCPESQYYLNNFCYTQCPSGFYNSEVLDGNTTLYVCGACPEFCKTCNSTRDTCMECFVSYRLSNSSKCVLKGDQAPESPQKKKSDQQLLFVVIAVSVCFVALSLFLLIFGILQAREAQCFRSRYIRASSEEDALDRMVIPNKDAINGLSAEMKAQHQGLLDLDIEDSDSAAENDITELGTLSVVMQHKC